MRQVFVRRVDMDNAHVRWHKPTIITKESGLNLVSPGTTSGRDGAVYAEKKARDHPPTGFTSLVWARAKRRSALRSTPACERQLQLLVKPSLQRHIRLCARVCACVANIVMAYIFMAHIVMAYSYGPVKRSCAHVCACMHVRTYVRTYTLTICALYVCTTAWHGMAWWYGIYHGVVWYGLCLYGNACKHVCMHVRTYIRTCVHVCTYVCTYACM